MSNQSFSTNNIKFVQDPNSSKKIVTFDPTNSNITTTGTVSLPNANIVYDPNFGYMDSNGQGYFSFAAADAPAVNIIAQGPVLEKKECPDCRGSGKYVGLTKTESCVKCNGTGQV